MYDQGQEFFPYVPPSEEELQKIAELEAEREAERAARGPDKFGIYRPSRPLSMAEVFDGRLRMYGLHEWDGWEFFGHTYEEAVNFGRFDPNSVA